MGKRTRIAHRSAVTGKFVKSSYAKKHPRTTVREKMPVSKPRKKGK